MQSHLQSVVLCESCGFELRTKRIQREQRLIHVAYYSFHAHDNKTVLVSAVQARD